MTLAVPCFSTAPLLDGNKADSDVCMKQEKSLSKTTVMVQLRLLMVRARGHEIPPLRFGGKMHQPSRNKSLSCILQRFCVAPNPYQYEKGVVNHSFFVLVRARGLDSRRDDAKPRLFRLCYAPRSVAALTCHRHVIHYRSPSSPLVLNFTNSRREHFRTPFCYWCGQEDLNLHRVAPTRT